MAQTLPLMSAFLGWLTLYQGRVKDRSLRRFLEGHSDEINAERLDRDVRFWFLSLGFHEDSTHSVQWLRDRKQSFKVHVCGRCGRKVHGNAIYRHALASEPRRRVFGAERKLPVESGPGRSTSGGAWKDQAADRDL